jgi:hypothetical protein
MLSVLAVLVLLVAPVVHRTAAPHPTHAPSRPATQPYSGDLFSRRARHRAAIILRLQWEELRLQQLERVRDAIRREIPIDELLHEAGTPKAR